MKKTSFKIPDQRNASANEIDSVNDVSSLNKPATKKLIPSRVNSSSLSSLVAANRAMIRPIYLTFKQHDLESEYAKHFVKYNLVRWQRTIMCMSAIITVLYVYFMIQYSADSTYWAKNYAPSVKGAITSSLISSYCPAGWYCSSCYQDMVCSKYNIIYDILFWFVTVVIPFVLGLIASFYLVGSYFTEHNDLISSIVIMFQAFLGVAVRYYVIENTENFMQPTMILIVLMTIAIYNFRIRFVYTLVTSVLIVTMWVLMNIPPMVTNADAIHASPRSYAIGFVCLVLTACIVSFIAYETEYLHRMQFLMSKEMKRNNAKLTNQLKLLAKTYNKKAGSLDSPLERSVMVIRSVMADPVLSSQHLMALGQVLALLSSSNLLTPDLEGAIGESLDNEQEAWLFSEIAARRRGGRAKTSTLNINGGTSAHNNFQRHRRSIALDVANKIEPTISEQPSIIIETETSEGQKTSLYSGANDPDESKHSSKQLVVEDPGAAYPPVLDGVAPLLSRSNEYNWPIFDFTTVTQNHSLTVLSHHIFTVTNLFEAFSIPRDRFRNFIQTIAKGYRADLPYHNSMHATDVLHCMYFMSMDEKVKQISSEIELLAMYLSAIVHDHDHPGLNNNFLVNTSDPKAVLYNDKSVLENHHAASSFHVLLQPEHNFLSHLSKADYKAVREVVLDLVLATDLTQHFTLLSMFKAKVASPETFDPYETREDRMLLYKIMIKCSDVSNPTKDMTLYDPWCRLILEEFYRQGDMEKRMGIPVSPYMDRDTTNVPSSQIGFIDYVVMPLYEALDKYLPIPSTVSQLQRNREHWAQLKAQGIMSLAVNAANLSGSLNGVAPSAATSHQQLQPRSSAASRLPNSQSQNISKSRSGLFNQLKSQPGIPESASTSDGLNKTTTVNEPSVQNTSVSNVAQQDPQAK